MRERWIAFYVSGTITVIGISLAIEVDTPAIRIALSSIMPFASLIVALNISSHMSVIEKLANFLRTDFNDYLAAKGKWAPYWDWHTRKGFSEAGSIAKDPIEKEKSNTRLFTHLVSVHSPSFVSLLIGTAVFFNSYKVCISWGETCSLFPGLYLILGALAFSGAIAWTAKSFELRTNPKKVVTALTPEDWQWLHEQDIDKRRSNFLRNPSSLDAQFQPLQNELKDLSLAIKALTEATRSKSE